jgi:diacylglycerol kinase (ATP)
VDKVKVILNPSGGRWTGQIKIDRVEHALRTAGIDYHLKATEAPGHGIELARQTSQEGWPMVVAAGGDGLINEVVNGLVQAAGEDEAGTLGIIPVGTANDLADMLALPRDITVACQRLVSGHTRLIDVGVVNGRYFANNSAVGLEPMVTLAHEQMRWVKGDLRYLLAALKTIINARSWSMRLTWDNGEYDGPVTLVSVGNSARTGGLFYMTPQAILDDGLLDFVCAQTMSRWQLLKLLPQTFKGGHIHHPLVIHQRTTALSIFSSPPTPIQADGEIIDKNATEINYRIIPNKLRVIV